MASIIYVARDIERALGKTPEGEYFIVTNKTPYSQSIKDIYPDNVFLIESSDVLDTHELLSLPEVTDIISKLEASILVFKNTLQIENICKEKSWKLLNPSAELAEKVENKISQVEWLGELSSLLPPHQILEVKDIQWNKKAFVLQWSHGHTGDGTILVQNEKDLNDLKTKFPNRLARVTDFIKGPMFTVNIVVTNTFILAGNISYQITGMLPFTENPFSTIGNDWSVTHTILNEGHITEFEKMIEKIGQKMQKSGWRGLFGIDVIYDEERDTLYLIEINARQPASTTFESQLQKEFGIPGMTTFDAHLKALLGEKISQVIVLINDGAQILQRVTSKVTEVNIDGLVKAGYKTLVYTNTKINSDLVRIQSSLGIMETHNKFNKRGAALLELL